MSVCSSMPGVRLAMAEEGEKRGGKYLHLSPKGGRVSALICTNGKKSVSVLELNHPSSVQSLSHDWHSLRLYGLQHVRLPLSITNSRSLFNLMAIELVMPSNHLILCCPLLLLLSIFTNIRVFSGESKLFASGGQSTGASASASVLPMNIQGWFPLGLTGLISLLSKGLSRVFSNTTVQMHHPIYIQQTYEMWALHDTMWAVIIVNCFNSDILNIRRWGLHVNKGCQGHRVVNDRVHKCIYGF